MATQRKTMLDLSAIKDCGAQTRTEMRHQTISGGGPPDRVDLVLVDQ